MLYCEICYTYQIKALEWKAVEALDAANLVVAETEVLEMSAAC